MTALIYDRSTQDIGNIVAMEHVNMTVPSQELATAFYIGGLGLTRDPYMTVGSENMWVNVGHQQFHLPTRQAQVIPGHIGLVFPDIEALKARLAAVEEKLAGTAFRWAAENGVVTVTCPWGNRFHCYPPDEHFGDMALGIPYVQFLVQRGDAQGIGRFYREVMGSPSHFTEDAEGAAVRVRVGQWQAFIFRETEEETTPYDGHHIAVYVANFSGPYHFLKERGLITEETDAHQYRFQEIVDPEGGRRLFMLEHEVRSLYHPLYQRELVNRDPSQSLGSYKRGRDALSPVGG